MNYFVCSLHGRTFFNSKLRLKLFRFTIFVNGSVHFEHTIARLLSLTKILFYFIFGHSRTVICSTAMPFSVCIFVAISAFISCSCIFSVVVFFFNSYFVVQFHCQHGLTKRPNRIRFSGMQTEMLSELLIN